MITKSKLNPFLLAKIAEAGHEVQILDGNVICSDAAAVQAIADSYDPLPDAKTAAIKAIKIRACELIETRIPTWKQRNLLAEYIEVTDAANDFERLAEIRGDWKYVKDVRIQSDLDEAAINSQTDWQLCVANFSAMEAIA